MQTRSIQVLNVRSWGDGAAPRLSRAARSAMDWAEVDDGRAVLDMACGNGSLLHHYSERYNIRACGLTKSYQDAAALLDILPRGEILHASACDIPWHADSFDDVFLWQAVTGTTSISAIILEALRVLKPDGLFIVAAHKRPLAKKVDHFVKEGYSCSLEQACQTLEECGLCDVSWRYGHLGHVVLMGRKAP